MEVFIKMKPGVAEENTNTDGIPPGKVMVDNRWYFLLRIDSQIPQNIKNTALI
jgi:hypothetical protein